jgi:hypothetical protein
LDNLEDLIKAEVKKLIGLTLEILIANEDAIIRVDIGDMIRQ